MLWKNVKLPFGVIAGKLIHVDNVPNGRACGCRCPKCDRSLEARNAGTIRAHYFAHYDAEECVEGTETAIHKMAKQIIADEKTVLTPVYVRIPRINDLEGNYFEGKKIFIDKKTVVADSSNMEDRLDGYTPDVTLFIGGRRLLVEIKVTHEVDTWKQEKVESNGDAMIEIDLSDAEPEVLLDIDTFKRYVIEEAPRIWIHNPKGEAEYNKETSRLRDSIKDILFKQNKKLDENNAKQKNALKKTVNMKQESS